jgi:RimJ/RimL family protein N-acetyltransferase
MDLSPRPIYITAYTDPKNIAMEKVLDRTGFELIATNAYDGEIENTWIKKLD